MSLDIIYGFTLILKGQGSSNNWREWQSWRDIRIQEFRSCCLTGISLLFFVSLECHPVILKILRNKLPANIAITNFSSLDCVFPVPLGQFTSVTFPFDHVTRNSLAALSFYIPNSWVQWTVQYCLKLRLFFRILTQYHFLSPEAARFE